MTDQPIPETEPADTSEQPDIAPLEPTSEPTVIRITLDARFDPDYIRTKITVTDSWGDWPSDDRGNPSNVGNKVTIMFHPADLEYVMDVVENYDVHLTRDAKAEARAKLAEQRWTRSQSFTYDGVEAQADPAIAVVSATLEMRRRRQVPAAYPQMWKLGSSSFRQWGEADIEAYGFGIADHIQACFDKEAALAAEIEAAQTEADVRSIDLFSGWPE